MRAEETVAESSVCVAVLRGFGRSPSSAEIKKRVEFSHRRWCHMANHLGNESGASAVAKGHALFPALDKNQRLSERVFLNLPVRLSGVGKQGADFLEEGQTVDISRQGAAVMVGGELSIGQAVKRSEEHTSELQSQSNLGCRLLLEK